MMSAYVRSAADPGFGSVVSFGDIQCGKTLLKTVDGEQHILLRDGRRVAQVRCLGEDLRVAPFAFELVVDEFPAVESRQRLIRRLADLYRRRCVGGPLGGWTVEAMRHRDALAAFDRRCERRSYREIAAFLYGDQAVRDEWIDPGQTMKNRVIRSVKRGLRMVNGGYRTLLI